MTGGGDYPDRYPPSRQCCDSRINEYHAEGCINFSLNAKWEALGVIVDHGAAGYGVSVYDLSGEPMPVRLDTTRSWGVRIPVVPFEDSANPAHLHGPATSSVAQGGPGVYRDLADVLTQDEMLIRQVADQVLRELLDSIPETLYRETYQRVAEFFVATLLLHIERNEMAHDAWRATGWAGNLMTLWGKAKRLMNNLWWFPESDSRKEKPLDHLGDTAIYSAFTAVLLMDGNERGAER